jgi:peptidoglycan/xylan/chitin deacetylase (PgdA/CDA1 family)
MWGKLWRRISGAGEKRALILMYHQVCEKKADPWQLAVHPEMFQKQLDLLKKKFSLVSLEELVQCLKAGKLRRNMVAITFDDGFVDNYLNAAPLLEWYQIPATFYVATNPLKDQKLYWWDELQSIILNTERLPKIISVKIGNKPFSFEFKREHVLTPKISQENMHWVYGQPIPNERISLYVNLWKLIQPLQHLDQYTVMRELRAWAGIIYMPLSNGAPMKVYQMQKLCENGLFSIGAHTVNHAMLGSQSHLVQAYEIRESKREIESLSGKKINGFAYPYGNYTALTQELLKQSGYDHAVCTEQRAVNEKSDLYALPRLQVMNWKPEEMKFRMNALLNE